MYLSLIFVFVEIVFLNEKLLVKSNLKELLKFKEIKIIQLTWNFFNLFNIRFIETFKTS